MFRNNGEKRVKASEIRFPRRLLGPTSKDTVATEEITATLRTTTSVISGIKTYQEKRFFYRVQKMDPNILPKLFFKYDSIDTRDDGRS